MQSGFRIIYCVKQTLLASSIAYFYFLAFVINFNTKAYGLDQPTVFAVMGVAFFIALAIEAGLVWWSKRKRLLWWGIIFLSYAILGLFVAPVFYGDIALLAAMFFPLAAVFIGGFVYAYSILFYRAFRVSKKLTLEQINQLLEKLPGWNYLARGLEKTYAFDNREEAMKFVHACGIVAEKFKHPTAVDLHENSVKLRLTTLDENSVTEKDVQMAHEFDKI
ncbi:4a-hydroxytetrahydrobiopterin dehydratase [Patescibacteria group bacterium]|nr:4a-hydroxytetrahydrobiopterin dehydratase [Patescibacteria group bacterium]MBU1908136.1 4a-hydroxytetrahydrobiopterin dehydratase [Patescibacteria group bacterium]